MSITKVTTVVDECVTLEQAQEIVGGYVEMVLLNNGDQMLVDEEGLLKSKQSNPIATIIAKRHIVGNVIILSGKARWG